MNELNSYPSISALVAISCLVGASVKFLQYYIKVRIMFLSRPFGLLADILPDSGFRPLPTLLVYIHNNIRRLPK
jgi:hypothetical protein